MSNVLEQSKRRKGAGATVRKVTWALYVIMKDVASTLSEMGEPL